MQFIGKQNADNEATYPPAFERANLYIQLMGVRSDSRRKGLGRAMIKHVMDEVRSCTLAVASSFCPNSHTPLPLAHRVQAKSAGVQLMLDTSVHENVRDSGEAVICRSTVWPELTLPGCPGPILRELRTPSV